MPTATETKTASASSAHKNPVDANDHRKNSSSGTPSLGRTFILEPGEEIEVDEIAKKISPVDGHEERLEEDLKQNGQLKAVIVVRRKDGQKKIKDGKTRTKILHAMGKSVRCIEYSEEEWLQVLGGKNEHQYLFALNISANEAHRQLTDDQKAITLVDFFPSVRTESKENSEGGGKHTEGERGRTTEKLAKLIPGLKPNRVEQAIIVSAAEELRKAVWKRKIAMSMAASIAKKMNEADRAIAAAKPRADAGDKVQKNLLNEFIALKAELKRAIQLAGTGKKEAKLTIKTILQKPKDGLSLNQAERESFDAIRSYERATKAFIDWFYKDGYETDGVRKEVLERLEISHVTAQLANLRKAMPDDTPCDACDGKSKACPHQCSGKGWVSVARLEALKERRQSGKSGVAE